MNISKTITLLLGIVFFLCNSPLSAAQTPRHNHTTTLMPDGDILLTGGITDTGNTATNTTEIYFTTSASWGWGPSMAVARSSHTATLLSDGQILVAGGFANGAPLSSAEIYNPLAKTWTTVGGGMTIAKGGHTATLLNRGSSSGKVLLCGGQTGISSVTITNLCEIYNTGANNFTAAAAMTNSRMGHTASAMKNGSIFVSGGKVWDSGDSEWIYLITNEIYDPENNQWTPGTFLFQGRIDHSATILNNGNVLITGGYNELNHHSPEEEWHYNFGLGQGQNAGSQGFLASAEIFNPNGGRVQVSDEEYLTMPYRNSRYSALLHPDGKLHIYGGYGNIVPTFVTISPELETGNTIDATKTDTDEAIIDASSIISFSLAIELSREVSGRIVDGDIFLSLPADSEEPSITVGNAEIFLERSTAPLDGAAVGEMACLTCERGDIRHAARLNSPRGRIVFDPENKTATNQTVTAGTLNLVGGDLDGEESTSIDTNSNINTPVSFAMNSIYIGGVMAGTATITGGYIEDPSGDYSVEVTGGVGQINTTVADDGEGDGIISTTINFTSIEGFVDNETTSTIVTDPIDISGTRINNLAMEISYTVDQINVSEIEYTMDISTIVIRGMIFANDIEYKPGSYCPISDVSTPLGEWGFGESSIPRFDNTAVLTPANDSFLIGGKNCEDTPDTDCLRANPVYTPILESVYIARKETPWEQNNELLNTARAFHSSTLLPGGDILTCGGSDGGTTLSSCELFDHENEEWINISSMTYPRSLHTATLLPNGTVLVAGGTTGSNAVIQTAEIFYPDTRRWVTIRSMSIGRQNHTATPLPNGNVLIAGGSTIGDGYSNTAEIYITTSAIWQNVGNLKNGRAQHTATLLKNGNVLIAGGGNGGALKTTEIYDYQNQTWSDGPDMNIKRYSHTANLLKDGRVIALGGSNIYFTGTAEIYNGLSWGTTIAMKLNRSHHRSIILPNGKLMVTGGETSGFIQEIAEGYDVDFTTFQPQGEMQNRSHHTTVLMKNGDIMNIGGWDGTKCLNNTDITYFSDFPDSSGIEPRNRNPVISTGTMFVDRGQQITLLSDTSNFHGITEASGGGPMNSSFSNPRVYLQAIDNPSGFLTDLTTRFYSLYGGQNTDWEKTISSITIIMSNNPGEMPYGWYHLRVAANAQFSEGYTVQVTSPRPSGLVINLVGNVISSNTIVWSWDGGGVINADSYAIFSSSDSVFITTSSLATPSYVQTTLLPNTVSSVKVAGSNLGGYGEFVKSTTYYTWANAPENLAVNSASFETAEIEWSPNGNSETTIYELSMSPDNFSNNVSTPIPFNNMHTSTSAVINQLSANQDYWFRVRAMNGSGLTTGFSNIVSTITVGSVGNLTGVATDVSEIRWSWEPAEGTGIYYEVYDVTTGTDSAVFVGSTTLTHLYQTSLSTNTIYTARINAAKGTNTGPSSMSPDVYTLAVAPLPGEPNVFTNINTDSIKVNWIANGNPENTQYRLEVSNDAVDYFVGDSTTGTSVIVDSLMPNTRYEFRMMAHNGDGHETATVTLGYKYTNAQAPSDMHPISISMSGVTIAWNGGSNPDETHYQIRKSTHSDFSSFSYEAKFSNQHTDCFIEVNGLLTSTTYYFDVMARNNETAAPYPYWETAAVPCVPSVYTLAGPIGAPQGSIGGASDPNKTVTISGTLPDEREVVSMVIPADSFTAQTAIAISSSATNSCGFLGIAGKPFEVAVYSDNNLQPQVPVTLSLRYSAAEATAIETTYAGKLVLARYNPVSGDCLPRETTVDMGNRTITADLNHFSIFQLIVKLAATDLDNIKIYPNPFYPNRGQGDVTIANMPSQSKIRIYTMSGVKVWEETATTSGVKQWKGVNKYGNLVASGIYLCVIDSSLGKKIVKIAVER